MTSKLYPPCPLTNSYPILRHIPPEEREAWVRQAEAGIELTDEQNARLGFHPSLPGGVLLPSNPQAEITQAQLDAVFGGSRSAFEDILRLGMSGSIKEGCYATAS